MLLKNYFSFPLTIVVFSYNLDWVGCALQTGSGKTYTMGTAYTVGGSSEGVIPKVMETIFKKIESRKENSNFQLRVSFIEV